MVACSAVVSSWCRPDNVRTIVRSLVEQGVREVVVVDCSGGRDSFPGASNVVRFDRDPGLYARLAVASLLPDGPVLVQDDDLSLPKATVEALVKSWQSDREVVHGLFGRSPKGDGSYARILDLADCDAAVVLTRALVVSRRNVVRFLAHVGEFDDVQRGSVPHGNGEDLILSYVAQMYSGRMNRVYALERVELPAPNPIHGRSKSEHWAHRTKLMRRLEAWLVDGECIPQRGRDEA